MLLYIHVPFCRRKCRYCAFHSDPLGDGSVIEGLRLRGYLDALLLELAQWGDRLGRQPVRTIFFGGGTPSLMPAKAIGTILDKVRRTFKVAPDAEISLEANPESLTNKRELREMMRFGVNRLSLGFQSLNNAHLKMLGRCHSAAEATRAYYMAREAYCSNINIDLMWGLPGQKVSQWLKLVEEVAEMRPEHISAYGLTLEPGTPLALDCEDGLLHLPAERDQALMYMQGSSLLEEKGFMQYEVSNYARMGYQCRHNMGYWEGEDYLGLGPAATSTVCNRRWTNPTDFSQWGRAVTQKKIPLNVETLDARTRVRELIMLRLRTTRGLRLKAYKDITGHDFIADNQRLVQGLHQNKLIRILNGYMRLTRSGMLVSNSILGSFFEATDNLALEERGVSKASAQGPSARNENTLVDANGNQISETNAKPGNETPVLDAQLPRGSRRVLRQREPQPVLWQREN